MDLLSLMTLNIVELRHLIKYKILRKYWECMENKDESYTTPLIKLISANLQKRWCMVYILNIWQEFLQFRELDMLKVDRWRSENYYDFIHTQKLKIIHISLYLNVNFFYCIKLFNITSMVFLFSVYLVVKTD